MKLLLDTNAYSAFRRGNKKILNLLNKANKIYLPLIVIGELYYGFIDGNIFVRNKVLLDKFVNHPLITTLSLDLKTAELFGEISTVLKQKSIIIQQNDIWIAALCKQHNLILISNDRGFKYIPALPVLEF